MADPVEVWALAATPVMAGSYSLAVIGTHSPAIASYGGNLAFTSTAVPEPEPYALLAAGMAVVGLLVNKRVS